MGAPTQRARFELPDFAFQHRLQAIARHKGVRDFAGVDLWNLRGFATDFAVLIPKILARVKDERYALIVLDPIYKGLGKRDGNKAGELFSILNPVNHTSTTAGLYRYKVEPYVMAGDVYAEPPHTGRGGWTWYTGAAGWMYQAGVERILGFQLRGTELLLDPCIPASWPC